MKSCDERFMEILDFRHHLCQYLSKKMADSEILDKIITKYRLAVDDYGRESALNELISLSQANLCSLLLERPSDKVSEVMKAFQDNKSFVSDIVASTSLPLLIEAFKKRKNDTVNLHFMTLLLFSQTKLRSSCTIDEDVRRMVVNFASELICSDSVGLSDTAGKVVERMVLDNEQDAGPLLHEFVTTCSNLASEAGVSSSIMKMRYCSIMSRILGTRDELFRASLQHGAVLEILDLCKSKSDPLLQMNAFELLTEFAATTAGYNYMVENGIMSWLLDVSRPDDSGSMDFMLIGPAAVDCLAAIFNKATACGVLSHDSFNNEKSDGRLLTLFVQTMTANLHADQEQARIAGFNALVLFGCSSPATAQLLCSTEEVVDALVGMLRSSKAEVKVAALRGLGELVAYDGGKSGGGAPSDTVFTPTTAATSSAAGTEIDMEVTSAQLFSKIARVSSTGQDTLGYLLQLLHQPFSDTRVAALALLGAAAKWKWSIPLFFHSVKAASFRDFLERHTEHDKGGKEAKFGIVWAICSNPGYPMLSEENKKFLSIAKARGPFYVAPEMADPQVI